MDLLKGAQLHAASPRWSALTKHYMDGSHLTLNTGVGHLRCFFVSWTDEGIGPEGSHGGEPAQVAVHVREIGEGGEINLFVILFRSPFRR